jgi:hypothetical protein
MGVGVTREGLHKIHTRTKTTAALKKRHQIQQGRIQKGLLCIVGWLRYYRVDRHKVVVFNTHRLERGID